MAYIEIINEDTATGTLKDDYAYLSSSYSRLFGHDILAPNVYRSSSLIPAYFRFGVGEFRSITQDGATSRTYSLSARNPLPGSYLSYHNSLYFSLPVII